jgi:hypothetical protein
LRCLSGKSEVLLLRRTNLDDDGTSLRRVSDPAYGNEISAWSESDQGVETGIVRLGIPLPASAGVLGGDLGASDRCTPRASHRPANRASRVLCKEIAARDAKERNCDRYPSPKSIEIDAAGIHLHLLLLLYC